MRAHSPLGVDVDRGAGALSAGLVTGLLPVQQFLHVLHHLLSRVPAPMSMTPISVGIRHFVHSESQAHTFDSKTEASALAREHSHKHPSDP